MIDTHNTINTDMKLSGTKPIYEEVAEYYEKMISIGVYKAGSYLPSVREVSLESKINPNTVQRGYTLLVEKGIILAIPKKGYQVKEVKAAKNIDSLKKNLVDMLTVGNYDIDDLKRAVEELYNERSL